MPFVITESTSAPVVASPSIAYRQGNGAVPGVWYAHQTAPWDSPLSFGVQALIEYNGYVLNDRRQADRIRVTNITGLDDADISDSREVVPGDQGEVAYDAFYRGRTIVMTGRIEAGSLGSLKRLERDLKAAFAPLIEAPMKFRWFDVTDGFDDSLTLQAYTVAQGDEDTLSVGSGLLSWDTTAPFMLLRSGDNRLWGDKQVTIRAICAQQGSEEASVSVVLAYMDADNYLLATYQNANELLSIQVVSAGVQYELASITTTRMLSGLPVWLRGRTEEDTVTAELWLSEPADNSLPNYSVQTVLEGSDADDLGDQTLTLTGLAAQTPATGWAIDDFSVQSLCPSDIVFGVRKMPSGMSIKDSQDSQTRFNRSFQVTARASQPFAQCATQSRSAIFTPSGKLS